MHPVSTRIPDEDRELLAEYEEERGIERAEALRRLVREALDEWRKTSALDGVRAHTMTIRQAADYANVPYVEMVALVGAAGIDRGYTLQELDRDGRR